MAILESFGRTVTSESFLEKSLLLVLTAALSGAVVPWALKRADIGREQRAALSRAQMKLFEDLSETILTSETLALDVTYFGSREAKNPSLQTEAFKRYSSRVVDLTATWRVLASRARTLASEDVAKKVDASLKQFFQIQDTPMNKQWVSCATKCDWDDLHTVNEQMLGEANRLIAELAKDLDIKP